MRTKKLADGSESYYLDIYVDGKRSYEFLKLYLLPGKSILWSRSRTGPQKAAVEAIKSKRIIELTHSKAGLKKRHPVRSKMLLDSDWMEAYLAEQERKGARGLKTVTNSLPVTSLYKKKGEDERLTRTGVWVSSTGFSTPTRPGGTSRFHPKSAADYVGYSPPHSTPPSVPRLSRRTR